jgi:hypothetical protein
MAKKVTINGELLGDISTICTVFQRNEALVRKALKVIASCGAVGMNLSGFVNMVDMKNIRDFYGQGSKNDKIASKIEMIIK